ncbi:MAG: 50S ribosomal protein L11 methyltransferase, partial [Pseudonocardia sp.]|nr:50S ribosomal protein L11 methyltransferase [Pseudonocardia sp.]
MDTRLPAGVVVHGTREDLARAFGRLAALQPVVWDDDGLVCAPGAAPDVAAAALTGVPFAVTERAPTGQVLDPPAAMLAGWYMRSPAHAPAPASVRELIQAPGPAFGWGAHATTAMCLDALAGLPAGAALDVGCGSGLLTQAWIRLGRGTVHAIDADAAATAQTRQSLAAAGIAHQALVETRTVESLAAAEIDGRVVLANIPAAAHRALCHRIGGATP